jgi:hypothetical protein
MLSMERKDNCRLFLAAICSVALAIPADWTNGFAAQKSAQPSAATQAPPQDIGWPRQFQNQNGTLIVYQPQVDEWKEYKDLYGRAAFSLTPKGGKETLGVVDIKAETLVDKDAHLAYFRSVDFPGVRFPSTDPQEVPNLEKLFQELAPRSPNPISIERLMADLDKSKVQALSVPLKNDPPQIFYSAGPAILLIVQGETVYSPISKTDLQFVVNTNWDLFFEKSKKTYYLLAEKGWFTAKDLKGPWAQTQALPKDMAELPAGENFDDVKKMVPPPPPSGAVPQIFFSSTPAELIVLKGSPVYSKIAGTRLLYITNTDNDVFVEDTTKEYYVLLSGRWFRAKSMNGPWTFASGDLPEDFAKIPENSPKAHVLSSVPGTVEASDAVMLAQIPTTAIVNKAEAEAKVKVSYDGQPQFKPIEQTSMQYATNTQDKVIKDGDLYYLCFQGVWFMSTTPNGPWKTADSVPKEIYTIPPSSPVYNVTYVTQTSTSSTTVESQTAAGYLGMFIVGAAVGAAIVYGTGYYYPPYVYWGPGVPYPVYRPWPCTYGVGAVYNPYTGGWAAGRAVYGPYGAAGSSAWYNPATGRYGRSASVQGWYGGRTAASSYNPWTGTYAHTNQGHNPYSQWGSSVATRGNQWVQTGHVSTAAGTTAGYRTSTGQSGVVTRGAGGNTVARGTNGTYVGHDGNVYRKDSTGNWSQYDNGNWNHVDTSNAQAQAQQRVQNAQANRSANTQSVGATRQNVDQARTTSVSPDVTNGLNRSAESRQRGQMQTQRFQNFHRGGGGGRFRR